MYCGYASRAEGSNCCQTLYTLSEILKSEIRKIAIFGKILCMFFQRKSDDESYAIVSIGTDENPAGISWVITIFHIDYLN